MALKQQHKHDEYEKYLAFFRKMSDEKLILLTKIHSYSTNPKKNAFKSVVNERGIIK